MLKQPNNQLNIYIWLIKIIINHIPRKKRVNNFPRAARSLKQLLERRDANLEPKRWAFA